MMPDKHWYLKQINLFSEMTRKEMDRVDEISRMKELKRGEIIYMPEDMSESVYLLKKGRVKISGLSEEGKEVTMDIIGPGEIFGELSLVDKGPRETIAETLDDALLCVISRADFEMLIRNKPELAFKVTKLIGLRRRVIESRLEDLVFRDVSARLARLLLQLAKEYGKDRQESTVIDVKLSQYELANLIGSTRETTSHFLSVFRREELIAMEKRRIVLLNRAGLEEKAEYRD
jgi:CRP-like cAMP-binding protein